MPLQSPTPLENATTKNGTRHIRSPHPHETYHVGHHHHVATPYDKHSKLYHADLWNWHDLYENGVSYEGSVVTRSQTAFNRIQNGDKETSLFADKWRHHPPNLPHLVITMKDGSYGAIPRTIITRSMATHLDVNPTLCKTLEAYESFKPPTSHFDKKLALKEVKENRAFFTGTETGKEIKKEKDDMEELHGSPHFQDSEEKPNSNHQPLRYIDQHKHWSTPSPINGKPRMLRESTFSQESCDSLSQQNKSPSSISLTNTLKEPSFTITNNPFSFTLSNSELGGQQLRGEYQGNRIQAPSISGKGLKRVQFPSPQSQDFQQKRIKSPSEGKQAPSVMFS